jgi:organic hydroperoxide reductase OsmC/OhrA
MEKSHNYQISLQWTGNMGNGTIDYRSYQRSHIISAEGKPDIAGSSDPNFRGDTTKYNPEELLVASLSACHMLWYLHLCAEAGIVVVDYIDNATGIMKETAKGGGHFTEVTLCPTVTITENALIGKATLLHRKAHELCYIANSVNFPVHHKPVCKTVL